MTKLSVHDMCSAIHVLSGIKRPSKRIKACLAKLEDVLCETVEGIQSWRSIPRASD